MYSPLTAVRENSSMASKACSACGVLFTCGLESEDKTCWCADYPLIMSLDFSQECRCRSCLKAAVREKIAAYLQTITPEKAAAGIGRNYATSNPPVEDIDYYLNEDGRLVFTAWYLLKRGECCQNGCRHCPYGYKGA